MSTKIYCVIYLKSKLESEFTKLSTGKTPNIPAAQEIQRLVLPAENISDGYFAKMEPDVAAVDSFLKGYPDRSLLSYPSVSGRLAD